MRQFCKVVAFAALAIAATRMPAQAGCTDKRAVWTHDMGDTRHVVYGTEGMNHFSRIYFEEWRGGRLAWRGSGEISCSSGASTCYGLIRNNIGGDGITEVVLERIDEDRDDVADWVIFAGLSQALWYDEGLKVEWFNGFGADDPAERIQASNIYQISGCRETDALVPTPDDQG